MAMAVDQSGNHEFVRIAVAFLYRRDACAAYDKIASDDAMPGKKHPAILDPPHHGRGFRLNTAVRH